ncbi:MAG: sugar phosphorylase [Treponema sp.]|jgi:sucrose phosphorylase|nr:sugar phosphorylase [Treponema sp.]
MHTGAEKRIRSLLVFIYGADQGEAIHKEVLHILREFQNNRTQAAAPSPVTQGDALLIAYADMLSPAGPEPPGSALARLEGFLRRWNQGGFTYLHILPFHPYSSDDGFSVIDYRKVDPRLGTWEDIGLLGKQLKLVFDFVLNHGSVQSPWFQAFLQGEPRYADWYTARHEGYDAAGVVRPRTTPLLSPFQRKDGSPVWVWTTFSADQADYNFANPQVLLEFIRIFLEYADRGGRIVRLDAIAYLWKEDGTPCIHHPKTHGVVKVFRAIIDALGLDLRILTETNVPHAENISYFGTPLPGGQGDEAHLVYNFALPPLVLHAALSADAAPLRAWAKTLPPPESGQRFLNFLASHDGVGLTPAMGLVDGAALAETIRIAETRGALVSYKAALQGPVPYELNCSYLSVIAPPSLGGAEIRARAFLAAQGVLLSLSGLPAVYFHSWIGSEAWTQGPALLGYNRAVNREKPPIDQVEGDLAREHSLRARIYQGFRRFLEFRRAHGVFNPDIPQRVLEAEGPVFALLRGPDQRGAAALCVVNLGPNRVAFCPPMEYTPREGGALSLEPWETQWIHREKDGAKQELSTRS